MELALGFIAAVALGFVIFAAEGSRALTEAAEGGALELKE
jgi:hypothetical protein